MSLLLEYSGLSDLRILEARDFTNFGVEAATKGFPRGQAVEVSDEVGQAILNSEVGPEFRVIPQVSADQEELTFDDAPAKPKTKPKTQGSTT